MTYLVSLSSYTVRSWSISGTDVAIQPTATILNSMFVCAPPYHFNTPRSFLNTLRNAVRSFNSLRTNAVMQVIHFRGSLLLIWSIFYQCFRYPSFQFGIAETLLVPHQLKLGAIGTIFWHQICACRKCWWVRHLWSQNTTQRLIAADASPINN